MAWQKGCLPLPLHTGKRVPGEVPDQNGEEELLMQSTIKACGTAWLQSLSQSLLPLPALIWTGTAAPFPFHSGPLHSVLWTQWLRVQSVPVTFPMEKVSASFIFYQLWNSLTLLPILPRAHQVCIWVEPGASLLPRSQVPLLHEAPSWP